jgi:hypothetical protein
MAGKRLMKLVVKGDYRNREVFYQKGQVIEVPEDAAEFLLRDAPGCFETATEKAVKAPEVNKMVDEPIEDKGSQGARGK